YADCAYTRPRINLPNSLGGTESYAPIRGILMGPDLKKLAELCQELNKEIFKIPSLADPRVALNLNSPEMQVTIDRVRASDLGVRVADIATPVRLLMSGADKNSTFKQAADQIPATMRALHGRR